MAQKRISLVASGNPEVGDTGPHTVGSFMLHISNTFVASIKTMGYVKGNGLASVDRKELAYKPMKTGVLTDPSVTQITTPGLYEVIVDGCQLVLEVTWTSGQVDIDPVPLRG